MQAKQAPTSLPASLNLVFCKKCKEVVWHIPSQQLKIRVGSKLSYDHEGRILNNDRFSQIRRGFFKTR